MHLMGNNCRKLEHKQGILQANGKHSQWSNQYTLISTQEVRHTRNVAIGLAGSRLTSTMSA